MKATSILRYALLFLMVCSGVPRAQGIGTVFTYQGQLRQSGVPQNGTCDLQFTLFDALAQGAPVGSPQAKDAVTLTNGLFTVELDFGSVFEGSDRWLEVATRCPAGSGAFTTLSPRQALTAVPYAQFASTVPAGSITSAQIAPGTMLPPSGPAGGSLAGTYPNPSLAPNSVGAAELKSDGSSMTKVSGGAMSADAASHNVAVIGGQLDAFNLGGIALLATSTSRAVIGRLADGLPCPGTYAVGGCAGTGTAAGVLGVGDAGPGVNAISSSGNGVTAASNTGFAVRATAPNGIGVLGDSNSRGVIGTLGGTSCAGTYAIGACSGVAGAVGLFARSSGNGIGVLAQVQDVTANIFVGQFLGNKARINSQGLGFFNGGTQTGGADFAESLPTSDDTAALEPGDVLEIDPQRPSTVRRARGPESRLVAGVYSTKPAVLAVASHGVDDTLEGEVPVGIVGVLPTKVTDENGPIAIGDLLVTATRPGYAMKARPAIVGGVSIYPTGAILGKALAPLPQGTGMIEVLVSLR